MKAGEFDRRLRFQRYGETDNGLEMVESWTDLGSAVWAARRDVSDAERVAAGWVEATLATRFTVRSSAFTRGITPKDRAVCEGRTFDIHGIKEVGRRDLLEITCTARTDLG